MIASACILLVREATRSAFLKPLEGLEDRRWVDSLARHMGMIAARAAMMVRSRIVSTNVSGSAAVAPNSSAEGLLCAQLLQISYSIRSEAK